MVGRRHGKEESSVRGGMPVGSRSRKCWAGRMLADPARFRQQAQQRARNGKATGREALEGRREEVGDQVRIQRSLRCEQIQECQERLQVSVFRTNWLRNRVGLFGQV